MKTRLRALDLLRFVAVTSVVLTHTEDIAEGVCGPTVAFISRMLHHGYVGVNLFFVLSGFLVSGLLFTEYQRNGQIHVGRFLVRRGFKIYPALYFLLICTFFYECVISPRSGGSRSTPIQNYLAEVLFVQNYFPGVWAQNWSLAVEEHFYLSFPAVLVALAAANHSIVNPFRLLPLLFLAVATTTLILIIIFSYMPGSQEAGTVMHTFSLTHIRIDEIFFGALIAYYYHFEPDKLSSFKKYPLAWLVFAAFCFWLYFGTYFIPIAGLAGSKVIALPFGIILLVSIYSPLVEGFSGTYLGRFMSYLGQHSYSIYIWHRAVLSTTQKAFAESDVSYGRSLFVNLTYIVLSFAVGILMAKLIEFPALRLRERFFKLGGKEFDRGAAAVTAQTA
jgi:peptidoglycan/LPS O-acetylase OafA/YrhL